ALRLPRCLVEELARTTTLAQQEWDAARRAADFARFRPWLEQVVALKRREAECLGPVAYDALLQDYEPDATGAELARLFEALRRAGVPLAGALAGRRRPAVVLGGRPYPVAGQRAFAERVASGLGFDFQAGRLDTAVHAFTIGLGPGDCRITTRFRPDDFRE